MSVDSLLDALVVQAVPRIASIEGTPESILLKDGSPSSLSSTNNRITLAEAIDIATNEVGITSLEVREALSPENIEDWHNGDIDTEILRWFAKSLVQRGQMDKGIVPAHFTESAFCGHCGPVWLPTSKNVLGCPWCFNIPDGKPIPRPCPVRCADCVNFKRINHPHLGHCAKGELEAIAGLWGNDKRHCTQYLPCHVYAITKVKIHHKQSYID